MAQGSGSRSSQAALALGNSGDTRQFGWSRDVARWRGDRGVAVRRRLSPSGRCLIPTRLPAGRSIAPSPRLPPAGRSRSTRSPSSSTRRAPPSPLLRYSYAKATAGCGGLRRASAGFGGRAAGATSPPAGRPTTARPACRRQVVTDGQACGMGILPMCGTGVSPVTSVGAHGRDPDMRRDATHGRDVRATEAPPAGRPGSSAWIP